MKTTTTTTISQDPAAAAPPSADRSPSPAGRLPDLTACDREPIHIPGSIQPFGFLLAVDEPGLVVRHASANVAVFLGPAAASPVGRPLADVIGERQAAEMAAAAKLPTLAEGSVFLQRVDAPPGSACAALSVVAHRRDGLLALEFEPAPDARDLSFRHVQARVETFISRLAKANGVEPLLQLAAEETRRITGFDRVLIYQFGPTWDGVVVAEDRNDQLPSYLGLHFPASDIPRQARELYRVNRTRIIADVDYAPVPIVPSTNAATGRPLDLSLSTLRSVSPVHLQYMRNMGTASSMSVSIVRDGELWGLISCHNATPWMVPYEALMACDFLARVFALQLAEKEHASEVEHRVRLKSALSRLLAHMTGETTFVDGLAAHPDELMSLVDAEGAAVVADGNVKLLGRTPGEQQVRDLVDWLAARGRDEVYATDALPAAFGPAAAYADVASGLLAASISSLHTSYVLWFRPEIVRTVKWAGDPVKPAAAAAPDQLHPRKSFETWSQSVRLRSAEWARAEVETAAEFRNVVLGIVLRKAEELAALAAELERSNKELEAFSYSVSHDLRAPFRHIVGYAELLRELKADNIDAEGRRYIDTIVESAYYAGTLVDNLLAFSQMGRAALSPTTVDMNRLVAEVRADVMSEAPGRRVEWRVADLPPVRADVMMLKLAVRNLLANAVKYTGKRDVALIEVGTRPGEGDDAGQAVFFVRDNGIGFDMKYVDKLFGVFQRLHRMEDFEGTGIGLANVRRIVSRHGGRTWAEGTVGAGATFYFSMPDVPDRGTA